MSNCDIYLKALGAECGTDIVLDGDEAVFADNGRALLLRWLDDGQRFFIYVEIGTMSGWGDLAVSQWLLGSNFMFAATAGGAFSYNSASDTVGLNFLVPTYGLDGIGFVRRMKEIVAAADDWAERFKAFSAEQERLVTARRREAIGTEQTDFGRADGIPLELLRI